MLHNKSIARCSAECDPRDSPGSPGPRPAHHSAAVFGGFCGDLRPVLAATVGPAWRRISARFCGDRRRSARVFSARFCGGFRPGFAAVFGRMRRPPWEISPADRLRGPGAVCGGHQGPVRARGTTLYGRALRLELGHVRHVSSDTKVPRLNHKQHNAPQHNTHNTT